MVGFAAFGPSRDDDARPAPARSPIYLAPEVVGTGVGRDLFEQTNAALGTPGSRGPRSGSSR